MPWPVLFPRRQTSSGWGYHFTFKAKIDKQKLGNLRDGSPKSGRFNSNQRLGKVWKQAKCPSEGSIGKIKGQCILGGGLSEQDYKYFHVFFLFRTDIYSEGCCFVSGNNLSTKLHRYIFKIISKCYLQQMSGCLFFTKSSPSVETTDIILIQSTNIPVISLRRFIIEQQGNQS